MVNNMNHGPSAADESLAFFAADSKAVPDLIKDINTLGKFFDSQDDQARISLLQKTRALWRALETPRETMIRHCWAEPAALCALTAVTEMGLWVRLIELDTPFKASELAMTNGIDPHLLSRLMRHLAAMGYLMEVGPDTYNTTSFTKAMALPRINSFYPCISGGCLAALNKFHEYGRIHGWNTPSNTSKGPFQYAYNTELNFFAYLHANPPYAEQFNYHMSGRHLGHPSWLDPGFYPVTENLVNGFDCSDGAAMIVDIGGSTGHDLLELHRKYPNIPGRLVLQDLPGVIEQIVELDSRIEPTPYNFFTEQPIKGSRAYFMHNILHDWPDDVCLKILANITAAMKPGYSKLLIYEHVIPATDAHWEATSLDVMMLTILSSKERTRDNWGELLTKAGLEIRKIWAVADGLESLIECELAYVS
ncbi:hypothetical protein HIM_08448 [Hirsutella minnesotensis 3608]|uniref:O-methyltransferase C-terminal domain-containing protein n=1 Tax=Hirsutella minnesotensis 3608 TaxID=1043627 RepID=A0A0F7ZSY7_9HYPO|nr:hypothetical protein HIM_08448 [Hirsutella minnesotensis 3608]